MLAVLRRFVTSPLPILTPSDETPSIVLERAADALATCIGRLNQDDLTLSTIYSLLNYLPSAKSDHSVASIRSGLPQQDGNRIHPSLTNRTPEERHVISSNTLFIVTKLAKSFHNKEVTQLALSMLLQRIRNADVVTERAALSCIADLASEAGKEDFTEVARAFADFGREASIIGGEGQRGIVSYFRTSSWEFRAR
jgi:phosphatidylinositol 4-kinase